MVAGVFLILAEVFLVGDLVIARIEQVGRRVETARDSEQISALAAQLRRNRPPTPGPFAWLSPSKDRTYVFVPVLLAAGILLSALAFIVERLSRVTAAPVAERELARGLASMALPATGLAPTGQLRHAAWDDGPGRGVSHARRNTLVVALVVAVMTVAVVVLRAVLITRPAPADPQAALVVDLAVHTNELDQPEASIALSLWGNCRTRIPAGAALISLDATDPDDPSRLRMQVSPAPALFDEREFLGCLGDLNIERAMSTVTGVSRVPTPSVLDVPGVSSPTRPLAP